MAYPSYPSAFQQYNPGGSIQLNKRRKQTAGPTIAGYLPQQQTGPGSAGRALDYLVGGPVAMADAPAGAVRNLLAGRTPSRNLADYSGRVSGRELIGAPPNEPGLDMWDIGGFAAEVATDPLTYAGGLGLGKAGLKALLTSGVRRTARFGAAKTAGKTAFRKAARSAVERSQAKTTERAWNFAQREGLKARRSAIGTALRQPDDLGILREFGGASRFAAVPTAVRGMGRATPYNILQDAMPSMTPETLPYNVGPARTYQREDLAPDVSEIMQRGAAPAQAPQIPPWVNQGSRQLMETLGPEIAGSALQAVGAPSAPASGLGQAIRGAAGINPRTGRPIYRPGYGPPMSDEELGMTRTGAPMPPGSRVGAMLGLAGPTGPGSHAPWQPDVSVPGGAEAIERAREAEELATNREHGFDALRSYERRIPFGTQFAAASGALPGGVGLGADIEPTKWEDWKTAKRAQKERIDRGEMPGYVRPWAGASGKQYGRTYGEAAAEGDTMAEKALARRERLATERKAAITPKSVRQRMLTAKRQGRPISKEQAEYMDIAGRGEQPTLAQALGAYGTDAAKLSPEFRQENLLNTALSSEGFFPWVASLEPDAQKNVTDWLLRRLQGQGEGPAEITEKPKKIYPPEIAKEIARKKAAAKATRKATKDAIWNPIKEAMSGTAYGSGTTPEFFFGG